ncbi:hypothetical protein BD324DRAFT_620609 [Kockovaella imperatae]|uniref:TauD/TfdA-like domain-containing protein n=1 Tax=Kockovaella imperatae TaxID=4999 RepID=A0A1Y1UJZ3_9TREE|nr:hypothetical protein BD324DRAFT_620609 [Kockovaella imperatae]ORX38373.1 hypothetical protein BD324DRAFT_620609 [Kockovaella imperatae]
MTVTTTTLNGTSDQYLTLRGEEPKIKKIPSYESAKLVDPFNYVGETFGDGPGEDYPWADFLPHNPVRTHSEPPLELQNITDRGHFADPGHSRLRAWVKSSGGTIKDLGICVGTVIHGVKMEEMGPEERDDLALLIAQRGVVFFRKQHDLTIDQQRALGAYFGPLHKHPTYATPRRGDLDDVVVVYSDENSRPDLYAFSRAELFHSDVTYELQPPGATILRLLVTPEVGNDTLWSSGYNVYSSLSRPYQRYLESLSAIHTGYNQAASRSAEGHRIPLRAPIETVHPVVRVHPVTGLKSVFVNPGFVTRIVGVPKAESDATLAFLKDSFAQQTDATVRWRWEAGDVACWDNRIVNHSATFDAYPSLRHGLRVTPHAEKPLSVEEYEAAYGKPAKDWIKERLISLGIEGPAADDGKTKKGGFRD